MKTALFRVGAVATLALLSMSSHAAGLSAAKDFNVFVFGNDTQFGTDSQGRIAVGGNALFNQNSQGYTVNSGNLMGTVGNADYGYGLVVGGNLTDIYNTINKNVFVGGNSTLNDPTINGNLNVNGNATFIPYGTVNGNLKYGGTLSNGTPPYTVTNITGTTTTGTTASPVDFAAAKTSLTSLSNSLFSTAANGTVEAFTNGHPSTLKLIGTSNTYNVFNVAASYFSSSSYSGIEVDSAAGSTNIINVIADSSNGYAVSIKNAGFTYNGVDKTHILYNFANAATLNLDGSFSGSLLAVNADVTSHYGNIDGQLIANSISGSIEAHDFNFDGTIPTDPVPEAGTVAGFGMFLLGGFAVLRRSKKQTA